MVVNYIKFKIANHLSVEPCPYHASVNWQKAQHSFAVNNFQILFKMP